jgi:hypothetical protein
MDECKIERIELHSKPTGGTEVYVCEQDDGVYYARFVGRIADPRRALSVAFALSVALDAPVVSVKGNRREVLF